MILLALGLVGCTDDIDLALMPALDGGDPDGSSAAGASAGRAGSGGRGGAGDGGAGGAMDPDNPLPSGGAGVEPPDAGMMADQGPLRCEKTEQEAWPGGMPCDSPIRWQDALTNGEPTSWDRTFLAFDARGNLYWLLTMFGHVHVDGREIGDPFTHTTLLISYGPDGQLRWVFDAFDAYADGLVVTDTQACIAVESLLPLRENLEPEHSGDAAIACLTLEGELRWSRSIDSLLTGPLHLTADALGNLYTAGGFQGTLSISTSRTAESRDAPEPGPKGDLFVVSYTAAGGIRWLVTMGGTTDEEVDGLAALPDGRVAILAAHSDDFTIAGEALPQLVPTGGPNGAAFVALFGEGGALEWAVRAPDSIFPPDTLTPAHIFIDGRGRIIASYENGETVVAYDEAGAMTAQHAGARGTSFAARVSGFVSFGPAEHPDHPAGALITSDFDFVAASTRLLVDATSEPTGLGVVGAVAVAQDGAIAVSGFWSDRLNRGLAVLEP